MAGGGPFEVGGRPGRAAGVPRPLRRHRGRRGSSAAKASPSSTLTPEEIVRAWRGGAGSRCEFELGKKHAGRVHRRGDRRADRDRAPVACGRRGASWSSRRARAPQDVGLFDRRRASSTAGSRRSLRRSVRVRAAALRGAQQGEPVRAARSLRSRGRSSATCASRRSCGSRSTGAGCTRTPSATSNLRPPAPAAGEA